MGRVGSADFIFMGAGIFLKTTKLRLLKIPVSEEPKRAGECLTSPLTNPLVAERAFRASEFWGLTRVSEVHGNDKNL